MGSPTLVLWDIDGTLVDSAKLGRDAFFDAFERVTGTPPAHLVPFAGRTDLEIALDLLERSGVNPDDGVLERFGAELEQAMANRVDELRARGRPYPGARESLERLGREPGVVQSLLTGNIFPNAAVKLGAFGLDTLVDLEIGAYGSDDRRRGRLVAVALQKCERKHGAKLAPRDVVVVGDTPLDVAAAREGGARSVAVATGSFGEEELRATGADVVLPDLTDTGAVVEAVLVPRPPMNAPL
jgi:phosphoglycolate phosphatase-like HAD superfamily hydrolase